MTQKSGRQVVRFENFALNYIRLSKKGNAEIFGSIHAFDFGRVACVCLLALYGAPRIDESLLKPWRRVCQSAAWQAQREKHPRLLSFDQESSRTDQTPFEEVGAWQLGRYFRDFFLPELAGSSEREKLNAVLAETPPWLIWFTNSDPSIQSLGLKAPDLTKERRFLRTPHRDGLPLGPFERTLRPEGVDDWWDVKLREYAATRVPALPAHLTPRERSRALRLMAEVGKHREPTTRS